jgi:hypothetical protein
MKKIESIKCYYCGKDVVKLTSEIKRRKKLGKTKFYCNNSCAGKNKIAHLKDYQNNFKKTKYIRKPDQYSNFRWYIKNIAKNSKKRKQDYDIDLEYLDKLWQDQKGICPFTKEKLELKTHNYNKVLNKPYQASLDRIDNTKGYIKGNVRFVALMFNYAKNNFSDDQVLQFCQKIVKNII